MRAAGMAIMAAVTLYGLVGCGLLDLNFSNPVSVDVDVDQNVRIESGSCPRGESLCSDSRLPDPRDVDPALNLVCTVETSGSSFSCTATGVEPGEVFELTFVRAADAFLEVLSPYVLGTVVNRSAGVYTVSLKSLISGRLSPPVSVELTQ